MGVCVCVCARTRGVFEKLICFYANETLSKTYAYVT